MAPLVHAVLAMPTTPAFDSISGDALTSVLGRCGRNCCKCPPRSPEQGPAPPLPPGDNVSVSLDVQP